MKDDIKMKYGTKKTFVVKQHATFIYYIFALIAKTAQLMHEKKCISNANTLWNWYFPEKKYM